MSIVLDAGRSLHAPTTMTGGRVRLRTLNAIRWVAIAGQAVALLIVHYGLGYPLPIHWALGVLLFLTGGLHNPFAFLILSPVTVSATILSRVSTGALATLALAVVGVLALYHLPLPWPDQTFALEPLFIFGMAMALGLSVVFIAGYVFSVAEEARRMSDALAATYMAL